MNVVSFGETACEKTRRYLDAYVSNELLIETNQEVLHHLEACLECAAEADARLRVKARLKTAVEAQSAPAGLQSKIRGDLQRHSPRSPIPVSWTRWAVAAAAAAILIAGISIIRSRNALPDIADRQAQDAFIQKVSETLSAVLRVGLGDHIHCAVFRRYPKDPPSLERLTETIGPEYQDLVPLVKTAVSTQYSIIMAHQCSYGSRHFVHVALSDGSHLVSLVIARKEPGESLDALTPTVHTSGVPVYQAAAGHYEIAGFETQNYLAFVVSDLNARDNLLVASTLAPGVQTFLNRMPG